MFAARAAQFITESGQATNRHSIAADNRAIPLSSGARA